MCVCKRSTGSEKLAIDEIVSVFLNKNLLVHGLCVLSGYGCSWEVAEDLRGLNATLLLLPILTTLSCIHNFINHEAIVENLFSNCLFLS